MRACVHAFRAWNTKMKTRPIVCLTGKKSFGGETIKKEEEKDEKEEEEYPFSQVGSFITFSFLNVSCFRPRKGKINSNDFGL